MTTKAKGTSVRQKITDLATKLDVPFQNIQTAFMIERLVARLVADKNLARQLVFKGGFVGLRVYNSERYTVDLDALLVKANIESTLTLTRKNAEVDLDDGVWFKFEDQMNLATQGEDISWAVYPIETICAEKIHALVTHGNINSRSKDVHDLSVFLPKVDATTLGEALKKCFTFREAEIPESFSKTIKAINTTSLQRGWTTATATVPRERDFKEAFNDVVKNMAKLEKSFK